MFGIDRSKAALTRRVPSQSNFFYFHAIFGNFCNFCQIIAFRSKIIVWRSPMGNPGYATSWSLFQWEKPFCIKLKAVNENKQWVHSFLQRALIFTQCHHLLYSFLQLIHLARCICTLFYNPITWQTREFKIACTNDIAMFRNERINYCSKWELLWPNISWKVFLNLCVQYNPHLHDIKLLL